jgi:N-acetylmuramoyl-L-alanine amidase
MKRWVVSGLVLLALVPVLAKDPARVEINLDASGPSERLLFVHSRKVTRVVLEQGNRIEVLYAEPVRIQPESMRLDTAGILEGWDLVDGRRLVLRKGPGFQRYESFELRNPDRLILDLQGNRDAAHERSGIVRTHPDRRLDPAPLPDRDRDRTVIVIDPGHGGSENGAVGPTGLREKEVALDLARRLKRVLQNDRRMTVVLTRDEDRHLDLDERTAIANHNGADLFISIHLNSSPRTGAHGAETYFLSTEATDDEARTTAALENRASGVGDVHMTDEGDQRDLELVLWDLAQNRFLAQSAALAESVQNHMNRLTGTRDRGVRQAPFRVLMGATMPAILVEVGFISNPEEEQQFRGLSYRNRVVDALAEAVHDFTDDWRRLAGPGAPTGFDTGGQ